MMEQFIGASKIKTIVLTDAVELDLPTIVKIHSVVNVSRIAIYKKQVEEQKHMRGKSKYLVKWKGYMPEVNTWQCIENLENSKKLVEKSKREYGGIWMLQKFKPKGYKQKKSKDFNKKELLVRYITKLLYK